MHQQQPPNNILITSQVIRKKTPKVPQFQQTGQAVKKIGEGPFSKIKLMVNIFNNQQWAIKKYNMFILKKKIKMGSKILGGNKYSNQAQEVYKQIAIWKKLNNRYVVKLHQIIYDNEQDKIYLVMDYCKYGDLATWNHKNQTFSTKWSYKLISKFFKQAALGLNYMHSLNIVHRDIKPQNILIYQDKSVKIIDFGRSVQLQSPSQKLVGSQGTYHFMAPEMLSEKEVGGYNGMLCDIWSLGVSMYSVIFTVLPFNDDLLVRLFDKIQKAQYKIPNNITKQQQLFIPLIKQMLNVDWNQRPKISTICQKLEQIQQKL